MAVLLARDLVLLQPREQRQRRLRIVQPHPHRQGPDEQADRLLHPLQIGWTARRGGAEHDVTLAAVAVQQHCPSRLEQRVQGHPMPPREAALAPRSPPRTAAAPACRLALRRRTGRAADANRRRGVEVTKLLAPELLRPGTVLPLQPGDVVTVRPRRRQPWRRAAPPRLIPRQHLTEQNRQAPAIQQRVMVAEQQPPAPLPQPHQRAAQQRAAATARTPPPGRRPAAPASAPPAPPHRRSASPAPATAAPPPHGPAAPRAPGRPTRSRCAARCAGPPPPARPRAKPPRSSVPSNSSSSARSRRLAWVSCSVWNSSPCCSGDSG